MSPATTTGLPSRTTIVSPKAPVTTLPFDVGTMSNGLQGIRGASRIYPHLEDLTTVNLDIDIHASIRKILQLGDTFAKQADTHLDFKRPDIALQEYLKAFTIATDIIPRHKEYPSLQADRGELLRMYIGLKKRINSQHQKFLEVKELIKENNARSGVKPASQNGTSDLTQVGDQIGHGRSQSMQTPKPISVELANGLSRPLSTMPVSQDLSPRQKPPVLPKPNSLLGNVISPQGSPASNSSQADLAARFARLRGNDTPDLVQDPRIRTRPITVPENSTIPSETGTQDALPPLRPIPRPTGPREMPPAPSGPLRPAKMKLPINVNIPTMPRAPDAIYSPASARSADTASTNNFPFASTRTTQLRPSSRQNSVSSAPKAVRTPMVAEEPREYFPSAPLVDIPNSYAPPIRKSQEPNLPHDSTTVNPGELIDLISRHRILLVDLRSREDFDDGHIMSQYIICIEPDIVHAGISAEQLEERIVLSPDVEQDLFKQRIEFDLVVFYSQNSVDTDSSEHNHALENFSKAVYEFAYTKQLSRRPLLLYGGLDAWTDLMGQASLQASNTRESSIVPSTHNLKAARPLGRVPRDTRRLTRDRRKTYESRPLTTEEEKNWDKVLTEDQNAPDDQYYVRTTEEFFRKYPEVSLQESMVVPSPRTQVHQRMDDAHQRELASTMPPPPARPAPALPRQSFSGVSERATKGAQLTATGPGGKIESISPCQVTPGHTGLHNFGNTCYMNAAIQCLSVTWPIKDFLVNYQYPSARPPRKQGETSDPPQLMVRNVGNLFRYMWNGQYTHVSPKTFKEYVHRVHSMRGQRCEPETYGGRDQQDSADFLEFLLEILSDELNPRRDRGFLKALTPDEEQQRSMESALYCARQDWDKYRYNEGSLITQYMQGSQLTSTKCGKCGFILRRSTPITNITLHIIPRGAETLTDALNRQFNTEEDLDDYKCDHCKCKLKQGTTQTTKLARLPKYLIIQINRFAASGTLAKVKTRIEFNVGAQKPLDMTPYAIQPDPKQLGDPHLDEGFKGPFIYNCYGIIQHLGDSISSGHYIALTRHGEDAAPKKHWYTFNDTRVTPATKGDIENQERPYLLFYERIGR